MKKILVVDPNVVFSGTLGVGHSLIIFYLNNLIKRFNFISPEFFFVEVGIHTIEIARRTKFSLTEAQEAIKFIVKQIDFIPESKYQDKIEKAREILKGHEKDAPYLALALAKDCNILSGDKTFKKLCPKKVKNPKEILEILQKDI